MQKRSHKKLGGKISSWGDTTVHRYGDDEVIKFYRWSDRVFEEKFQQRLKSDYETAAHYLGDFVVPTQFIQYKNKSVRTQPYISGRFLSKDDLNSPIVAKKFQQLIERYNKMVNSERYEMDLIGHEGIIRGKLGNIILTGDNQLKIFDCMLFKTDGLDKWAWLMRLVMRIAKWRQHHVIKKFTKYISK